MSPRRIEIIGGGLAGLSLGVALRREGVPVSLHDAGAYPRHRVCGEFIAGLEPSTIARLGLAGALRGALRHGEVAWHMGRTAPRVQALPAPALALSRHTLDARLAREFSALGGELHTRSRLADNSDPPGRVRAHGRRRAESPDWIGLKLHVRGLVLGRDLEMHLGRHAYVGLTQVEGGAVNVCGLFRRRPVGAHAAGLLPAYLRSAGLAELADRIDQAEVVPGSNCAVAALAFDAAVRESPGLRIGDAGAAPPPFTGNGMAMAFQGAELALDPLLAYARGDMDWPAACQAVGAARRHRFRLRLASASFLHPFLLVPRRQRWVALLSRTRMLPFRRLYAALH